MNFPMGKEGFQRARRNAEPMASVHEGLLARWEIEPKTGVLQNLNQTWLVSRIV
jgi:hypothetical protein